MERRINVKIIAVVLAVCMVFTAAAGNTWAVFGASADQTFEPAANGTRHQQAETPALIITGQGASGADGFTGNYKILTENQMKGINSEETAKAFFPSAKDSLYLDNIKYSCQTKEAKGGWGTMIISGLNLKSVAQAMGIDTSKAVNVFSRGTDGYSGTLVDAFSTERYAFPNENAEAGDAVDPAIAFNSNIAQSELPRLVFGQMTSGDFNMLGWAKWLKCIWIGSKENVLTLNLGSESKSFTLADIIGTKSGSYTSTYQYTDDGKQVTVQATGIPLDKLISDAGFSGASAVKINTGESISAAEMSRYFLAYDAEADGQKVQSSSQLILYGPGTEKEQAVNESVQSPTVEVTAPAAVTGLKAVKNSYSSIKLTWKKASGAEGYNIYRYDSSIKKYELLDAVEGATKLTYTDRGLNTGAKYTYKVKAYKTVGTLDLESAFSAAASAVPALDKTAVKLSKSGKNAIKAKWSKVSGASGYQLILGTNKTITKGKKTYTIKKGSTVTKQITKLKTGKKYYVKVRPYRNVGSKKVYGTYSAVKSIKR